MKKKSLSITMIAIVVLLCTISYIHIQPSNKVNNLKNISEEMVKEEALRFQSPDITLLKNLIAKLIEAASI
jgi:hypothetical protein